MKLVKEESNPPHLPSQFNQNGLSIKSKIFPPNQESQTISHTSVKSKGRGHIFKRIISIPSHTLVLRVKDVDISSKG